MQNVKLQFKITNVVIFFLTVSFFLIVKPVSAAILINEFSSYETSGDWVEIYSDEANDTDISGWMLKDTSSSVIETVPANTKIGPSNKFFVFDAGNRLNKGGDTIYLVKTDGSIASQVSYGGSNNVCEPGSGESIGRYPNDGSNTIDRFKSGTKGTTNAQAQLNPCPSPTPQNTNTPTNAPTATAVPTYTNTPTRKITKTPTPTKETQEEDKKTEVVQEQVLSSTSESSLSITPLSSPIPSNTPEVQSGKVPLLAFVFMGGGVLAIGTSSFLFIKNRKKI